MVVQAPQHRLDVPHRQPAGLYSLQQPRELSELHGLPQDVPGGHRPDPQGQSDLITDKLPRGGIGTGMQASKGPGLTAPRQVLQTLPPRNPIELRRPRRW